MTSKQWNWMMDYCRLKGISPADNWSLAADAWEKRQREGREISAKTPNTRPKSYEGCDLVIAEALKAGLEIECGSSEHVSPVWIVDYNIRYVNGPYITSNFARAITATPYYPPAPKLKPFPELVKVLLDAGYRPDKFGGWKLEDSYYFNSQMVEAAIQGKMINTFPYLPEWLED